MSGSQKKSNGRSEQLNQNGGAVRVMVVDDHALVRLGLAQLIDNQSGYKVVAQAEGMADTMRQLSEAHPDLMTIDISLQNGGGIELIKQIRAIDDSIRMLVISMHDETIFAERVLKAGAMGYLNKEEPYDRVIEALRTIEGGQIYLSPTMTTRIVSRTWGPKSDVPPTPLEVLSDRELEVFELLGRGFSTRSTADTLHISIKTVETHRERIKNKLGLKNGNELIKSAYRWNFEQGSMRTDDDDASSDFSESDESDPPDSIEPIPSRPAREPLPKGGEAHSKAPPKKRSRKA